MAKTTSFKYTFPVLKAESRSDGLYLIGLASGPEVDKDGERISPEAITNFAKQIEDRVAMGDPLPYRDAHADDGVLMELGSLVKGWVDGNFHLGVEVRLDESNPAAQFLHSQVRKGKQYGMSVSGRVLEWADEFVSELGKAIRTFKNVVLDEISNTTRPAWYPSFGSVLAKSVGSADDSASSEGDTASMDDELHGDEDVAVEESADDGDPLVAEVPSEDADAPADAPEEDAADVEKAGRPISAKNREALLALYNQTKETLTTLGLLESEAEEVPDAEKSAPEEEGDTLTKAVDAAVAKATADYAAKEEALITRLSEATARIEALENAPRTQLPGAITDETKKTAQDELAAFLAKASPSDRLRFAFAAQHGEGVVN